MWRGVQIERGSMPSPALRSDLQPEWSLLRNLETPPSKLVAVDSIDPALSQHGYDSLKELRMSLEEPFGTLTTSCFLVGYGKEDQIAGKTLPESASHEEGFEVGDAETLCIERTPTVYEAIRDFSTKGRVGPALASSHDICMMKKDDALSDIIGCLEPRI
jgi:hypothetical protein